MPDRKEKILNIQGICKNFEGNRVLKDVSFQIEKGEFVAVMGQSGCGKSTLLYSISGMDKPTKGEVFFEGRTYPAFRRKKRKNCG